MGDCLLDAAGLGFGSVTDYRDNDIGTSDFLQC